MSEIAEITATAVESLIIVMLCNRFLCLKSNKLQRTKKILFFLLLFIKTLLFDQIKDTEFISAILMTFLILGYAIFILDGKIYEKILLALFPLITIMLINQSIIYGVSRFAGYPVAGLTQAGAEMRIPILFFSKLIFFFACEIFIRLQRHGKYSLTSFQWIVQLSCLLITFLIALFLWNMSKENHALRKDFFYIHMMLILFNILLYILLSKMQSDSMIREEYRISKITLAAQEKFVKEAQERYMETRTLHHDMRHYLMTAAKLIDSGNIQEAEDYIEKIINEKVSPAAAGVNTGDVVIDAVINSKIAYCSKNNIEIKCLVDTHLEDISDIDLSILLANALDNAITGCAGVDMPQINWL